MVERVSASTFPHSEIDSLFPLRSLTFPCISPFLWIGRTFLPDGKHWKCFARPSLSHSLTCIVSASQTFLVSGFPCPFRSALDEITPAPPFYSTRTPCPPVLPSLRLSRNSLKFFILRAFIEQPTSFSSLTPSRCLSLFSPRIVFDTCLFALVDDALFFLSGFCRTPFLFLGERSSGFAEHLPDHFRCGEASSSEKELAFADSSGLLARFPFVFTRL